MSKFETSGKITKISNNNDGITELEISEHKTFLGTGINGRIKITMDSQATAEFTQLAIKNLLGKKFVGTGKDFILPKLKQTLEGKTIEITIK